MSNVKSRKTPNKKPTKASWKGFINISLSNTHKQAIKDNTLGINEAYSFLESIGLEGYKVSLSCEPDSSTWTVAVTQSYSHLPNPGYAFSMRHKDLQVAISAVYYVHVVMSDHGDWASVGSITSEDDW